MGVHNSNFCRLRFGMTNPFGYLCVAGMALVSVASAYASSVAHGYPDGDYYTGLNLGYSLFSYPNDTSKRSKVPINIGVVFGKSWELSNFTSYLGYELQANYYGHAAFRSGGSKISANLFQLNLFLTGTQYFNTDWNAHAKVGLAYQIDTLSGGNHSTVSGAAPVVSVGLGYRFSLAQSIVLDYTHTFGKTGSALSGSSDIMQIDAISLGWRYYF